MRSLLKVMYNFNTTSRYYSSYSPALVTKSIYLSKLTDIFTNLALEDWFYNNMDFINQEVLMLWQNDPCVVIGRHQNPWIECNFAELPYLAGGAKLARRNSGGGTVYHDLGNLNLTFFTTRKTYSRKRNLELISRSLKKSFGIDSEISSREDLCIRNYKISGTASKLGRNSAYHHCTLLVNANKKDLSVALKNGLGGCIKTNASMSVKSEIMNISEEMNHIHVEDVMKAVIEEYKVSGICDPNDTKIIEQVNDDLFPGITDIKKHYQGAAWRYEKTPKFELWRDINFLEDEKSINIRICLIVEQGKVTSVELKTKDKNLNNLNFDVRNFNELINNLVGKVFSRELLDEFEIVVTGLKNSEICRNIVLRM